MKLVHIDLNQRQSDVQVGFQFDHDGQILEVTRIETPHKPSAQGKLYTKVAGQEADDFAHGYYVTCFNMKFIEREDQGWVHPDVQLTNVCAMYEEMYDDSIIGLDLVSVIDMVGQVDLEHLQHHPEYLKPMLEWVEANRIPASLKKQSS